MLNCVLSLATRSFIIAGYYIQISMSFKLSARMGNTRGSRDLWNIEILTRSSSHRTNLVITLGRVLVHLTVYVLRTRPIASGTAVAPPNALGDGKVVAVQKHATE